MPKVTFEIFVNADLQKTFKILTDFENFESILPEYYSLITTKSVRDESSLAVEHLHLLGNEFVIMAKHFIKLPNIHEMRVIGGDIKGSYMIEKVIESNDKTKIIVDVDIKTSKRLKNIFNTTNYENEIKLLYQQFVKVIEN
tara:strand:+ start:5521 stop:5943 length:423 start_codon:yes stop_codon:yes gene_type:complete